MTKRTGITKEKPSGKVVKVKQRHIKSFFIRNRTAIIVTIIMVVIAIPLLTIATVNAVNDNRNKKAIVVAEKIRQEKEASRIASDPITPEGLLGAINKTRTSKGLQPLSPVSNLETASQQGCADLVSSKYFDYVNPNTGKRLNTYMIDNIGNLIIKNGLSDITKATNGKQTATEAIEPRMITAPVFTSSTNNSIGLAVCKAPTGEQDLYIVAMVAEITGGQPSGPAGTANNQQSTSQYNPGKYTSGSCTKTVIPQSTVYENASWMYVGETKTYPGIDGWKHTCTPSSDGYKPEDIVYQGLPTTIYRGTKPKPEATPTPTNTFSYSQALSTAKGQCSPIAQASGTGSSAYQQCINSVLAQYGY